MLPIRFGSDRRRLRFVATVKDVFRFLEQDHGFVVDTVEEPTYVRYRNGPRLVVVSHGRNDYHVDVEVGKRVATREGTSDDLYSLYGLIGGVAPEIAESLESFESRTAESVRANLERCAALLRQYALPALAGEDRQFEATRAFAQKAQAARSARHRAIWERRREAAVAWNRGDHETARRLLESLVGELDEEEQARLRWLRSRAAPP